MNVALRKTLDLYGAVRPVRSLPGVQTRFDGVDLVVVRENTEGLYAGIENEITRGVVTSVKVATRDACTRIADFAFRYAVHRKRRKVSVFHKANIMKLSDGMFINSRQNAINNSSSLNTTPQMTTNTNPTVGTSSRVDMERKIINYRIKCLK